MAVEVLGRSPVSEVGQVNIVGQLKYGAEPGHAAVCFPSSFMEYILPAQR